MDEVELVNRNRQVDTSGTLAEPMMQMLCCAHYEGVPTCDKDFNMHFTHKYGQHLMHFPV